MLYKDLDATFPAVIVQLLAQIHRLFMYIMPNHNKRYLMILSIKSLDTQWRGKPPFVLCYVTIKVIVAALT